MEDDDFCLDFLLRLLLFFDVVEPGLDGCELLGIDEV